MALIRAALVALLLVSSVYADGLQWDYDTSKGAIPSTVDLMKGDTSSGPWMKAATIPAQPSTYTFPYVADNKWYLISDTGGTSNAIVYTPLPTVAYDDTAIKAAITSLTTRVTAIEAKDTVQDGSLQTLSTQVSGLQPAPPPSSRLIITTVSPNQIDITCVDGTRPATTVSGTKRSVACP